MLTRVQNRAKTPCINWEKQGLAIFLEALDLIHITISSLSNIYFCYIIPYTSSCSTRKVTLHQLTYYLYHCSWDTWECIPFEEIENGEKIVEDELYRTVSCLYFKAPGPQNTEEVLKAVKQRARQLSIKTILVATCSGKTGLRALEVLGSERTVVAITHVTGFTGPNQQELPDTVRGELIQKRARVFTGQHAFGGVGRGIRNKLGTFEVDEIMAWTLRLFGQGTKVAIELALMAADAGLARTDEDVISIGGTATGADTALVVKPSNSAKVFDLKVREVICKPFMI
jgi:hypothetical protein